MANGLRFTFLLRPEAEINSCLSLLLREALDDFFIPHTSSFFLIPQSIGAMHKRPETLIKAIGGFIDWKSKGISREALTSPDFPLLSGEKIAPENFSTISLPYCSEEVLSWKKEDDKDWILTIFGDTSIRVEKVQGITVINAFRELITDDKATNVNSYTGSMYRRLNALFYIKCFYFVSSRQCSITLNSSSELWLSNGRSAIKGAKNLASENLVSIVSRLQRFSINVTHALEDVSIDSFEGEVWIKEASSLLATIKTIDGMHVQ